MTGRERSNVTGDEDLVVIPLPLSGGGVTYAVARLVEDGGRPFAEAIVAIPDTRFAPPKRVALSAYSLTRVRTGAAGRPELYLYKGMILAGPGA
jgi:hypothetical protein